MKRGKKLLILLLVLVLAGLSIFAVEKIIEANIQGFTDNSIGVVTVDTASLTEISWTWEGQIFSFRKDGGSWVYAPDPAFALDQSVMEEALEAISEVRAEKVLENVEDVTEYGLDAPTCTVTAVGSETVTIDIGKETPFGDEHYISVGDGKIYVVRDLDLLNRLTFSLEELAVEEETTAETTLDTTAATE